MQQTPSVQGEHEFTINVATNVATTADETGWATGFGPIQVRPSMMSTLPQPLAVATDYFWISRSPMEGRFAASKSNAQNGSAITLTSPGGPAPHLMGLSRTLANISNVFFEIDEFYARWPAIDGMFFDEMNDIGDAQDLNYYGQIFAYVKAKGGKALVIQNPGKGVPGSMLGVADVLLTFEGAAFKYAEHTANLETSHPTSMFWHAVYACPVHAMPGVIAASRAKNAGYVYVTDRSPQNQDPWKHIAAYFQLEVNEVQHRNSPGAVIVR
ncbi:MAG: hypothetical protein QOF30_3534 [Acidimicrobiaceae bacterium]|nr:hypothetical protein [Acidimicrobiaceae bacterium]